MSLKDTFIEIFSPVEHEAEAVAKSLAHTVEKELRMSLPQEITDVIARIKALISGASDQNSAKDAQIASLTADKTALQGQLVDCQTLDAQKDAQVADLTSQLSDATSQLSDIEQQLLALSPAA